MCSSFWSALFILALASACTGPEAKLTCATNSDCHDGYVCDTAQTKICLRSCTADTSATACLNKQHCDLSAGDTEGFCRDSDDLPAPDAAADDGVGGDPRGGDSPSADS